VVAAATAAIAAAVAAAAEATYPQSRAMAAYVLHISQHAMEGRQPTLFQRSTEEATIALHREPDGSQTARETASGQHRRSDCAVAITDATATTTTEAMAEERIATSNY
jgi:hypothetical protein